MGHIIPAGTGFQHHKKVNKFVDRKIEQPLDFNFVFVPEPTI